MYLRLIQNQIGMQENQLNLNKNRLQDTIYAGYVTCMIYYYQTF